MLARVWGCRGSLAAPGETTLRYGGNTSCVEVRLESGHVLVLDAGTGMRPLGTALTATTGSEVHILLTHLHLDHLQGLGFFQPLFRPGTDVHIWGPPSPVQTLAERIAIYLSPPLFPVRLADVPASVTFHDADEDGVTIGSAVIRAGRVTHQGPTVGYRIEEGSRSLAYLPDHEPALGGTLSAQPDHWMSGYDVVRDVDVLFHDAQYLDEEYPDHVGWGHSAIGHALEFAQRSRVGRLVLFHHDPYHTDADLEALLEVARRTVDVPDDWVSLAYEGMSVGFDEAGVRVAVGSEPGDAP
jgi:phosphoribosyl 1,2-cyclic phosphodiesterase